MVNTCPADRLFDPLMSLSDFHDPKWAKHTARSVAALLLREMSTTYGRSAGGYAWAVLEPAAGIALLTILFSLAFEAPPLGDNFPLFYASGLLPFTIYVQIYVKVMVSIWFSKPLLQYPAVSYIDAILSRFALALMTQIVVFTLVLAGIFIAFDPRATLDLGLIALALALTALLGLGVGVLNCLMISLYPAWQRLWNVLHRPMFLISGIFFLFETAPEPYRSILWFNPLIHITGLMRRGIYPTYDAPYVSIAYVAAVALICLTVGLFFLRRWHKDFLYH